MGLTEEDTRDMHDYIMNITLARGSGEYCICKNLLILTRVLCINVRIHLSAHILAPGAHARMPLVDRVAALKIPITFVCMYLVFYQELTPHLQCL